MPRLIHPAFLLATFLAASPALAQQSQPAAPKAPKAPKALSGIVLTVNASAFILVDKTGAPTTVPVNGNTTYLLSKNPATIQDVVIPGNSVKATPAPDGSAAQVTSSGNVASLNLSQIKTFMGASDDEWAVLKPRIDRIQKLQAEADGNFIGGGQGNNQGSGGGGGGGAAAAPPTPTEVELREKAVGAIAFVPNAPTKDINANLTALREARAKAREALTAARKDLTGILTPRQEVLLVIAGILE